MYILEKTWMILLDVKFNAISADTNKMLQWFYQYNENFNKTTSHGCANLI